NSCFHARLVDGARAKSIWHDACLACAASLIAGVRCVKTPQYFTKSRRSAMQVLVASSSAFRRDLYRQAIHSLGHEALLADGGVDCVRQMRNQQPQILLLEAPLLWGGSDGVLDVLNCQGSPATRVILVAAGTGSIDWFQ